MVGFAALNPPYRVRPERKRAYYGFARSKHVLVSRPKSGLAVRKQSEREAVT
jgi:hypothetical protein